MLELGGQKLKDYFDKWNGQNTNKEKLISKLIKGAAIALEQFHKHGFHMDVHEGNFLVALNPDQSEQNPNMKDSREINCKLIDFDTSIINAENHFPLFDIMAIGNIAPEIRGHIRANITDKADVWAFGLMVNRLYNNIQYLGYT
ncbi:unnamed protein product [Meloidogyne enterolobii]|uniref:Uncharacterized protein n=1 Tax=Meloidogyne enterolobii TaxID=390850 RepID=A0ACB1AZF5_MELEN